jgi:hypothetical protein
VRNPNVVLAILAAGFIGCMVMAGVTGQQAKRDAAHHDIAALCYVGKGWTGWPAKTPREIEELFGPYEYVPCKWLPYQQDI